MARINLLPWREEQRARRKREFAALAGLTAIGALILALLGHFQIGRMIGQQEARNAYLQGEIAVLDRRIKEIKDIEATRAKLQARINIIAQLQQSRPRSVHLMDELVRTLPEGVNLTSVVQRDTQVTLDGMAQSNARVSAYMRNVDASPWMQDTLLDIIQSKAAERARENQFILRYTQTVEKVAEDKPAEGAAAEEAKP
jgi:type IV pilus assembly protein PilN